MDGTVAAIRVVSRHDAREAGWDEAGVSEGGIEKMVVAEVHGDRRVGKWTVVGADDPEVVVAEVEVTHGHQLTQRAVRQGLQLVEAQVQPAQLGVEGEGVLGQDRDSVVTHIQPQQFLNLPQCQETPHPVVGQVQVRDVWSHQEIVLRRVNQQSLEAVQPVVTQGQVGGGSGSTHHTGGQRRQTVVVQVEGGQLRDGHLTVIAVQHVAGQAEEGQLWQRGGRPVQGDGRQVGARHGQEPQLAGSAEVKAVDRIPRHSIQVQQPEGMRHGQGLGALSLDHLAVGQLQHVEDGGLGDHVPHHPAPRLTGEVDGGEGQGRGVQQLAQPKPLPLPDLYMQIQNTLFPGTQETQAVDEMHNQIIQDNDTLHTSNRLLYFLQKLSRR